MLGKATNNELVWAFIRGAMPVPVAVNAVFCIGSPDTAYDRNHIQVAVVSQLKEQTDSMKAQKLLGEWIDDTLLHSSPEIILESEFLKAAKDMRGTLLIDDVLDLLDSEPYHATIALQDLIQSPPIGNEIAGDVDALVQAWKEWARERRAEGCTELVPENIEDGVGANESVR